MTGFFFVIGAVGLVLLALSLIFDAAIDLVFEADFLSGPAISAFITAFGFAGAAITSAGFSERVSIASGLAAGLALGGIAALVVRAFTHMPTDPSVRSEDFTGLVGAVITPITPSALGEVSVRHLGQIHKLSARAAVEVPEGSTVRIVRMDSSTLAAVEPAADPSTDHNTTGEDR